MIIDLIRVEKLGWFFGRCLCWVTQKVVEILEFILD